MKYAKNKNITMLIISLATLLILITGSTATASKHDEPTISIFQGSETGTSVIEVIWPDGKIERLVYKNSEIKDGGHIEWFNERMNAYGTRRGQK